MSEREPLSRRDYAEWLGVARRLTARPDEAEDLLHRALLAALRAGRLGWTADGDRAWFYGVLRNQARMQARTEGRRRRRDLEADPGETTVASPEPAARGVELGPLLDALPAAQRRVLVLLLVDLDRREICDLLEINDATLRQRMVALRRSLGLVERAPWLDEAAAAWSERESQVPDAHGRLRRALVRWLRESGNVGAVDPDGHPLAFDRTTIRKPKETE